MEPIRKADQLLRSQHGVLSRRQAIDVGITPALIRYNLESGAWTALSSGVYTTASSVPSWERQLHAALLAHPSGVVGGRSAAALHDFSGATKGRPEILMPFEGNARSALARVIRSRHFDQVDTGYINGFPATSIAETILTLSLRDPPARLERLVDHEIARNRLSVVDFHPILDRLARARQPGLKVLRRIIHEREDDSYQPPTTELERLLYGLLDHPEIPSYERQAPLSYETVDATVDAYVESWSTIVEGDGRRWHTRKADFERDRQRDNAAIAAGLVVVRFTWKMLRYEPESCLQTLLRTGRNRQSI